MRIGIQITHLNDPRVLRTLQSLQEQTRRADAIIVSDGGSRADVLDPLDAYAHSHAGVEVWHQPGSVAETRKQAFERMRDEFDVIVLVDADETCPPSWLEALVAPILAGDADIVFGPTAPGWEPRNYIERHVVRYEAWMYDVVVPAAPWLGAAGNSAWSTAVFQEIGDVDATLTIGGEDYDLSLRAKEAGFRFAYAPDAVVLHNQSHLNSLAKYVRKRMNYNTAGAQVYLKHRVLTQRAKATLGDHARGYWHPLMLLEYLIKPIALIRAVIRNRRARRLTPPATDTLKNNHQ